FPCPGLMPRAAGYTACNRSVYAPVSFYETHHPSVRRALCMVERGAELARSRWVPHVRALDDVIVPPEHADQGHTSRAAASARSWRHPPSPPPSSPLPLLFRDGADLLRVVAQLRFRLPLRLRFALRLRHAVRPRRV